MSHPVKPFGQSATAFTLCPILSIMPSSEVFEITESTWSTAKLPQASSSREMGHISISYNQVLIYTMLLPSLTSTFKTTSKMLSRYQSVRKGPRCFRRNQACQSQRRTFRGPPPCGRLTFQGSLWGLMLWATVRRWFLEEKTQKQTTKYIFQVSVGSHLTLPF